jgi:hypothetical protein
MSNALKRGSNMIWRAPKFLVGPKLGPSQPNSRIGWNSGHIPSFQH